MEALHEPSLRILEGIDATFDPRRAPDAFVPFLASWVDLERIFDRKKDASSPRQSPIGPGLGRLRELTAAAAHLSKWRGTEKGLLGFLETATGESGFKIVENVDAKGRPRHFHILVLAPEAALDHRTLLERIIEQEKPAYVTYELAQAGAPAGG